MLSEYIAHMINTIFSIDIYEKALYRKIFIVKFVLNIILLIYL
ncbi:hypothetical protein J921_3789 [Acinetobacter baumannii 25493_8]|nr:hypothetical protein J470_3629 [Acinetobacter baumannii 1032241]EXQ83491.1 hypothetical protein J670_3536 [Acinetobacter baumannii 1058283]EYD34329.1 hypothetical protein J921_3789 [Acinetobacter baumannii 25493_8]EYR89221.1 hypothetical protein K011_3850 [Acinetobacter baumannii 25569_5]EYS09828.1 hypothetical protein K013_3917 [Acinetobacter baumannii 25569_7]